MPQTLVYAGLGVELAAYEHQLSHPPEVELREVIDAMRALAIPDRAFLRLRTPTHLDILNQYNHHHDE